MAKCCTSGGLNNRDVFSHGSGGQKSRGKGVIGLVPSEASLLCLQVKAVFSLCSHMVIPQCMCVISSPHKDPS